MNLLEKSILEVTLLFTKSRNKRFLVMVAFLIPRSLDCEKLIDLYCQAANNKNQGTVKIRSYEVF